jgi:hypothetical protein
MKYLYYIILSTFSLLLIGCEYEATYSYKIKNNSAAPIKVIRTNTNGRSSEDTFIIDVTQQTVIAVNGHGISSVKNYETSDDLHDITKIEISKNDTLQSKTNFLKTNRWSYKRNNSHNAEYLLTVNDSDF